MKPFKFLGPLLALACFLCVVLYFKGGIKNNSAYLKASPSLNRKPTAGAGQGICNRNPFVRKAILDRIRQTRGGYKDCADVTADDLSNLTGNFEIMVSSKDILILKGIDLKLREDENIPISYRLGGLDNLLTAADFKGLSGITQLNLIDSVLLDVPDDYLSDLTSLKHLNLQSAFVSKTGIKKLLKSLPHSGRQLTVLNLYSTKNNEETKPNRAPNPAIFCPNPQGYFIDKDMQAFLSGFGSKRAKPVRFFKNPYRCYTYDQESRRNECIIRRRGHNLTVITNMIKYWCRR